MCQTKTMLDHCWEADWGLRQSEKCFFTELMSRNKM